MEVSLHPYGGVAWHEDSGAVHEDMHIFMSEIVQTVFFVLCVCECVHTLAASIRKTHTYVGPQLIGNLTAVGL